MLDYLKIVGIISTHGLRGEVKVYPTTEDVRRYDDLDTVYIEMPHGRLPVHVEHVRYFKNLVIVKFRDLNRIEDVEPYLKHDLYVSREDAIELEEGEYFLLVKKDSFKSSQSFFDGWRCISVHFSDFM